jgi:N6-L-threonylcarbamoyladenine synthase
VVVLGIESSCDETGAGLVRVPPLRLCTDNGAMVAAIGDLLVRAGARPAPADLSVDPSAPLECAALSPLPSR